MIVDNSKFEYKHKMTYTTISRKNLVFAFHKNKPLKRMKRGSWSHTDEFLEAFDLEKYPKKHP